MTGQPETLKNKEKWLKLTVPSVLSQLRTVKLKETQLTVIAKRSAYLEQKLIDYQNRLTKQETELIELSNMQQELKAQLAELTESFQQYKKRGGRKD